MHEVDGYLFLPSKYTPPVGHAGLDVFLTPHPAERAFDTAQVVLQVEEYGRARSTLVNYAASVPDDMHLVPGQLALRAHGQQLATNTLLPQSLAGLRQHATARDQEVRQLQKDPTRSAISLEFIVEDITDEDAMSRVSTKRI